MPGWFSNSEKRGQKSQLAVSVFRHRRKEEKRVAVIEITREDVKERKHQGLNTKIKFYKLLEKIMERRRSETHFKNLFRCKIFILRF